MDSIGLMALRQQVDYGCQLIVLARYLHELQAHPFAGRPLSLVANTRRFDPIAFGVGLA